MKKLTSVLSTACLVAVLALTILPITTVSADNGPQGGSNSTGGGPPPPPSGGLTLWDILRMMLGL